MKGYPQYWLGGKVLSEILTLKANLITYALQTKDAKQSKPNSSKILNRAFFRWFCVVICTKVDRPEYVRKPYRFRKVSLGLTS